MPRYKPGGNPVADTSTLMSKADGSQVRCPSCGGHMLGFALTNLAITDEDQIEEAPETAIIVGSYGSCGCGTKLVVLT